MRTKGEHKRPDRKNEISSWVPHRCSFGCHATFPVLVTRTSYYVKTPRISGLRKKKNDGGYACLFAQDVPHKSNIFHKYKRLISEWQNRVM